MRSDYRAAMQSAIWSALGERVRVQPPDRRDGSRRPYVEGVAIFVAAGNIEGGADGAQVLSEDEQFKFRRVDSALICAAVRGAVIHRLESSPVERFTVDAVDDVGRGETHAVTVTRDAE